MQAPHLASSSWTPWTAAGRPISAAADVGLIPLTDSAANGEEPDQTGFECPGENRTCARALGNADLRRLRDLPGFFRDTPSSRV
jgi:hypothetical protein